VIRTRMRKRVLSSKNKTHLKFVYDNFFFLLPPAWNVMFARRNSQPTVCCRNIAWMDMLLRPELSAFAVKLFRHAVQ
jgi:hypothetical protein